MDSGNDSAVSEFLASARAGLFGLLYVFHKRQTTRSELGFVVGQLIVFCQILGFVLNPRAGFAWTRTIAPLQYIARFSILSGYYEVIGSPSLYLALVYLSGVFVVLYTLTMAWVVREFALNRIPPMPLVRSLRGATTFSMTVGFIPIFQVLLSAVSCSSPGGAFPDAFWPALGYSCFIGGHAAYAAVALALAVVFLAVVAVFTLVFVESHPLLPGLRGCSSGRAALFMLLWKAVLVALVEAVPEYVSPVGLCAIVLLAGLAWLALVFWLMPATSHLVNRSHLARAAMFTITALAAVIGQSYPGFDAAVLVYAGALPAAMLGILLANIRRNHILRANPSDLASPIEVDMWVRYTLAEALERILSGRFGGEPAAAVALPAGHVALTSAAAAGVGCPVIRVGATAPRSDSSSSSGVPAARLTPQMFKAMDIDERTVTVPRYLPGSLLDLAEAILQDAALRFPRSPHLQLYTARFYLMQAGRPRDAMGHLVRALRLGAPLDVEFEVYMARRAWDSQDGGSDASSTITRLGFDKAMLDARAFMRSAVSAQAGLFREMCKPEPRLSVLHAEAVRFSTAAETAAAAFAKVFAIDAQSSAAMHLYAQFNEMVANDPERAELAVADADRIEEQAIRAQSLQGSSSMPNHPVFVPSPHQLLSGDACGTIVISTSPQSIGQITFASTVAAEVFGYTRAQLEHRDVNVIIPEPIASAHGRMLQRYMRSGISGKIEVTHTMLARHRLGHLVSIQLRLRDLPPTEAGIHGINGFAVVANVRLVDARTSERRVIANGDGAITSGTLSALRGLGATSADLATGSVLISDVFPDLASWYDNAISTHGCVIELHPLRSASATSGGGGGNATTHSGAQGGGASAAGAAAVPGAQAENRSVLLAALLGGAARPPPAAARVWLQRLTLERGALPLDVLSWVPLTADGLEDLRPDLDSGGDGDGDDEDSFDGAVQVDDGAPTRTSPVASLDEAAESDGESSPTLLGEVRAGSSERVVSGSDEPANAAPPPSAPRAARATVLNALDPAVAEASAALSGSRRSSVPLTLRVGDAAAERLPGSTSGLSDLVVSPRTGEPPGVAVSLPHAVDAPDTARPGASAEPARSALGLTESQTSEPLYAQPAVRALKLRQGDPASDPAAAGAGHPAVVLKPAILKSAMSGGVLVQQIRKRASFSGDVDRSTVSGDNAPGKRLLERLRAALVEDRSATHRLPTALRLLWWSVLALTLTNVVLATVQAVVVSGVFATFAADLAVAYAGERTAYSLFPLVESIRYCMLDTAGFVNRSRQDVLDDRAAYPGYVNDFNTRLQSLANVISAGADPAGISSASRAVALVDFDNAPLLMAWSITESDSSVQPVTADDPDQGSTNAIAPLEPDGAEILLGANSKMPVLQASWAVYGAAAVILEDVTLAPTNASINACSESNPAPWMVITNGISGAQFHERATQSMREATVRDSKDSITRTSLVIFVVMLLTISLGGAAVILPSVLAVQRLQDELVLQLNALSPALLQALAVQAERRLAIIRQQEEADGGTGDDDGASVGVDDQADGEDRRLLGGGDMVALDFDDSTGEFAWGKLLERVKVDLATPGSGRYATGDSASTTRSTARSARAGFKAARLHRNWFSPRLLLFLLPVTILVGFYAVVFAVSNAAVGQVLTAQSYFVSAAVRSGLFRETLMVVAVALGAVGYESYVQGFISTTWEVLVDIQALNSYMIFNSVHTGRPIGRGLDSNPSPSTFYAYLAASELNGVPGVATSSTAEISSAMLEDACPLAQRITGISLAACYSATNGPMHGGLLGLSNRYVALAESLVQPKADLVAWARQLDTLVPQEGFGWSLQEVLNSEQLPELRKLGNHILWPCFAYVADLYEGASESLATGQSNFVVMFTASFTAAYTVLVIALLLPMIRVIGKQLRQKRGLLLLLPSTFLVGLPPLKELALTVLAAAENDDGNVAGRRLGGADDARVS